MCQICKAGRETRHCTERRATMLRRTKKKLWLVRAMCDVIPGDRRNTKQLLDLLDTDVIIYAMQQEQVQ